MWQKYMIIAIFIFEKFKPESKLKQFHWRRTKSLDELDAIVPKKNNILVIKGGLVYIIEEFTFCTMQNFD